MFDKLIESDTAAVGNDRRGYFAVTTVVVGILFVTALIASLYAQNLDLGVAEFDVATLLAPVAPEAPEPPAPIPQQPRPASAPTDVPRRQTNTLRPEENPTDIPPISVMPNTQLSRPSGRFFISSSPETNTIGSQGTNTGPATGGQAGTGSATASTPATETDDTAITPPPPRKAVDKPRPPQSIGVANGIAKSLPKPPYPPAAIAVGASGEVSVQVTIDERGNVISSRAVSGHPFLKQAAERAAWNAKFTPTLLSNQPVKVTGVIVYKFTRN